MFTNIYQIQISSDQCNAFNAGQSVPSLDAKRRLTLGVSKFKAEMCKYFTIVAKVDTDDLEEAFELTNLWNEPTKITKYSQMSSTSVGDIFQQGDRYYMVDTFGFQELQLFADELETM